ncbi:aminotransferase-like domain-containing protein [Ruegeria hyattellae]|uniref:aminotransferase-like domain-containing protein n=1 Tax=Ruegeria hyattellae TaxID=3233337 RepID=UPI00355C83BE
MVEHMMASRMAGMKASEIRELLKLLDQPGIISFAGGIPDPALFPTADFAEATAEALSDANCAQALQYSVSEGYLPLRRWIALHMAGLGIPCAPDQVMITSGSQQALDYLGKMFLSPGDTALVGWPTYLGALAAFNAYEPYYEQLNLNGNRAAEDYRAAAQATGGLVKFAYLSADFSNPTGETVDRAGRERLLALAEELDCPILEDAAYQALRYDGAPVPPILALELAQKRDLDSCRTIYCGSFSKTLSPGLRLGWVVAARPVISKLVLLKQASDLHTATLNQMVVCAVAERAFDSHVARLRTVYGRRRDRMLAALAEHMPEGVTWTRPEGGMFIWVTLPPHLDGATLLAQAIDTAKLAFVPGQAFFADGSGGNTLRLAFSCADEAATDEGIRRLGVLLRAQM